MNNATTLSLDSLNHSPITTFNDAWNLVWELSYQFNSRSGSCENNRYQKHLQCLIGNLSLTDISPLLLDRIKSSLLKSGRRPQTVKHILNIIKRVYNFLIKYSLFHGENPVAKIAMPNEDSNRQRYLTKQEAEALLIYLRHKNEQLWQISLLSLSTGMRASEIFHLKGEHIDLEMRMIRIVDPKNGKNRCVYIPDSAYQMLCDCNPRFGQLVFPNTLGKEHKYVNRTFNKAVKRLGLNDAIKDPRDKVVFHSLRHTFASWMVQCDQPLYLVAKLMGHSNLEMTKRYAHFSPERLMAATAVLNSFV